MRRNAATAVFCLAVGYALAHFTVAFYNHWYFASHFWLKTGLLAMVLAAGFALLLLTGWGRVWRWLGAWWILTHLLAQVPAGGPDLRNLAFVAVLDFEVAVVWVPLAVLLGYGWWCGLAARREQALRRTAVTAELKLRRRLRQQALRRPLTIPPVQLPAEGVHDAE